MTESSLQTACLKLLRAQLVGSVIIKHADARTSGAPDASVTWLGKTSWWEFKHGPSIKWAHGLQQLTCRRLAAAGECWVVLYEERQGQRQTVILTPDGDIQSYESGFSHQLVIDFIRQRHEFGDSGI